MSSVDSDLVALHAIVRGRVQGIFFRAFVQEHAAKLGLSGYVRNLPGGREVEVRAEGGREQLKRLLQHLYRGPLGAKVDKVEVDWTDYSGAFSGFRVRYYGD